jgi:hypothetical protein
MALSTFYQAVRSHWRALARRVWPDSPEQQKQAEIARLTDELACRHRRLVLRNARIEQIRDRLARQQRRIAEVEALVRGGAGRAWELALDLERLHRAVGRNRSRLRRHQEAYHRQVLVLQRKKQLRLALERGEVVVRADRG